MVNGCLEELGTHGAQPSFNQTRRPEERVLEQSCDRGATKYGRTRASAYAVHTCLHRRRSEVLRGTPRYNGSLVFAVESSIMSFLVVEMLIQCRVVWHKYSRL